MHANPPNANCIATTVPINDSSAPNDFNINGCDDLAIELEMDVVNLTNKNTHIIDKIVDTFPNHDVLLFLSLFSSRHQISSIHHHYYPLLLVRKTNATANKEPAVAYLAPT